MLLGRIIGFVMIACALLVAGADLLRLFEARNFSPLSLEEIWGAISPTGPAALREAVIAGRFPGLWDDVIRPVLALPGAILLFALGGLLLYLNRKRHLS
ncbi:hypothetical protein [Luteithermobacter gelatinilyticus]|uniref:hypothetical protein n=1 Tax=Luteithermobacter gelatinilyticus TaxID=2582913 RepID=UPI001106462D|nr:hypothetical protein [Luteithermobacter gelatinilyticus]